MTALPIGPWERFVCAAQDLGLIGGGVQGKGEYRTVPCLAKKAPKPDCFKLRPESTKAIVNQESLSDQRRAAEEINVGVGEP